MNFIEKSKKYIIHIITRDEEIRRTHFLVFGFIGIPLMIGFGLESTFVTKNYPLSLFIGPILLSLIISIFLQDSMKNPLPLFRINMFLLEVLFLFMLTTGGVEGSMIHWMYIYPLSNYFLMGKNEGMYWNFVFILLALFFMVNPLQFPFVYPYAPVTILRFLIAFLCVSLVTLWFEYYRQSYRDRLVKRSEELQKALAEVKTLRGYLPVCASCRKVREEDGSWINLEVYVEHHLDAEISHGLCNECAEKLYPSLMEEMEEGSESKS